MRHLPEEAKRLEAEKLLVFIRHLAAVVNQLVPGSEYDAGQQQQ